MGEIRIKRVYADADPADGFRVLVDRRWPRGLSKVKANLDRWDKDIAPSPQLCTWWDHDPDRSEEFTRRYCVELDANPPAVDALVAFLEIHPVVTLLYSTRNPQVNHAEVLRRYLQDRD